MERVVGSRVHGPDPIFGIAPAAASRVDKHGHQRANDGLVPGWGGTHIGQWKPDGRGGVYRDPGTCGTGGRLNIDKDGTVTRPGLFGNLDADYVGKMGDDGVIRDSFNNVVEAFKKD